VSPPLVRICVTGPECTGKTDLARRLAEHRGTECVPEASRAYAIRVARPLLSSDVEPIGRDHVDRAAAAEARTRARGGRVVMLDTDLVSTIVYARHYYGIAPPWVVRTERQRRADLYLLCDVDVPWIADGVRDRPTGRDAMFEDFRRALARRGAQVVEVRGDWEARWQTARAALSAIDPG
jgi:NadR type nicotinamide-nucleotide adenylyltransferase